LNLWVIKSSSVVVDSGRNLLDIETVRLTTPVLLKPAVTLVTGDQVALVHGRSVESSQTVITAKEAFVHAPWQIHFSDLL
jgi:hypothetical protein